MHIGFIGIGNMGEPVVHNLLAKGFTVTVHDLVPERAARVVEEARATCGDNAGNLSNMRLYEDAAGAEFRPREA